MFDLSDHQLTTIATWAEVGILGFMLWEKYGPTLRGRAMTGAAPSRPYAKSTILKFFWDNRTIAVALFGLGVLVWLNLKQHAYVEPIGVRQQLQQTQSELGSAKSKIDELEKSRDATSAQVRGLQAELDVAAKDRDDAKQELKNKLEQIVTLDAQLRAARQDATNTRRDLEAARKAGAKPSDTAYVPTHMKLQFNAAGYKPVEIEGSTANIHWSWVAFREKHALECPEKILPWLCYSVAPRGDKNDIEQNIVLLTLVFDKPITYKEIQLFTNGASFQRGVIDHTDRFAIIEVWPDPANFVLGIEVTPP
ncbi:MAG: hypothetical protein ACHQRJ_15540 [Alphaproteobacteria bacterium]